MTRVAHIQPNEATGGKPPVTGYIHHSQILQRSLIGVPCSVFSSRTHHSDPEPNWYIYHSDHLGSSAFLTDASGDPTQHLQYMPFGETFVEQRSITSYYTPYTFSAKERDTETGYSYFGARYYDADISVWLSVDPMADKYPSMSAYMYVGGHPTIITDPDGRDWIQDENGNYVYDKTITKDTQLKEGQTYLGASYEIEVVNSSGKYQYSYNLNEDGTFSDTKGNEWGIGSEYDPGFKSGNKIINKESQTTYHSSFGLDLMKQGYTYVDHKEVATYMRSDLSTKSFLYGGLVATVSYLTTSAGGPSLLFGVSLGALSEVRSNQYFRYYEHYSVNGDQEGIYYKDRFIISGDRINVFRDIVYKNGKRTLTIQPY
jgi:RHS repeat-associated protein